MYISIFYVFMHNFMKTDIFYGLCKKDKKLVAKRLILVLKSHIFILKLLRGHVEHEYVHTTFCLNFLILSDILKRHFK
jgi:hypothetical protein